LGLSFVPERLRWLPRNIRTRLTLGNVLVLALVVALYAVCASAVALWDLRTQLARYAIQDVETVEGLLSFASDGTLTLRDEYHNHAESKKIQERYLEVLTPDGQVIFRNDRLGNLYLGGAVSPGEGQGGYSERTARLADGTRIFLVSRLHSMNGRPLLMRLAYSEEPLWDQFRKLLTALLLALPVALAAAGFASYVLARQALAPIERMVQRSEQIMPERLSERLPIDNPDDELGRLARVFNALLSRLEQAFDQMRRFTADASHELRTPLTAIRSVGEVGLRKSATREEYQSVIGSMLEEANRLTALIDNLLTISRADAGQVPLQTAEFSLMDLARESTALLEVLADEKSQKLQLEGDDGAMVRGDRMVLRQAAVNVLHNAIKFSPVGSSIFMRVWKQNGECFLSITDSGPGIAEEHWNKVFNRFYRVDRSRSADAGGTGLGLSIAQWAAELHGGKISLKSARGSGCAFQIELPNAASAQS
jgi:heavy metal sensor kinase